MIENKDIRVAIVVPSLQPGANLHRLLKSLIKDSQRIDQIVVVDQSREGDASRVIVPFSSLLPQTRSVRSSPGLSKARNVGLRHLVAGSWDVVLLPDDDVRFLEGSVEAAVAAVARGVDGGSGRLVNPGGQSRLKFQNHSGPITRANIWKSTIEACYFLTPKVVESVGDYNESLGLGAPTPWGSGEGTDLLLRALSAGFKVEYVPSYLLEEEAPLLSGSQKLSRIRAYARGTGRVYRLRYPLRGRLGLIMRSLLRISRDVLRGSGAARESYQVIVGRIEGLTGWVR